MTFFRPRKHLAQFLKICPLWGYLLYPGLVFLEWASLGTTMLDDLLNFVPVLTIGPVHIFGRGGNPISLRYSGSNYCPTNSCVLYWYFWAVIQVLLSMLAGSWVLSLTVLTKCLMSVLDILS